MLSDSITTKHLRSNCLMIKFINCISYILLSLLICLSMGIKHWKCYPGCWLSNLRAYISYLTKVININLSPYYVYCYLIYYIIIATKFRVRSCLNCYDVFINKRITSLVYSFSRVKLTVYAPIKAVVLK